MKIQNTILNLRNVIRGALMAALICSLGTVFVLYAAATAQSVTLTVVNNSPRDIRYLYLSPTDSDNWGADQLSESAISPGATRTLNITWDQAAIKLVGEDQDGCFLSTTKSVTSNIEWTIASDAPRNCGN
jgi:hypothetical protein